MSCLPKNMDEMTFSYMYNEKVAANPLLKLKNFLNFHPIFRIRSDFFQNISEFFRIKARYFASEKKLDAKKKQKIKFIDE